MSDTHRYPLRLSPDTRTPHTPDWFHMAHNLISVVHSMLCHCLPTLKMRLACALPSCRIPDCIQAQAVRLKASPDQFRSYYLEAQSDRLPPIFLSPCPNHFERYSPRCFSLTYVTVLMHPARVSAESFQNFLRCHFVVQHLRSVSMSFPDQQSDR